MSIKLYPPNIAGTIPAFNGTTLVVPFSMNRAVAKREVGSFALKIKTVYNSTYLKDATYVSHDFDNGTATFNISNCALIPGNYYKIQMAYVSNTSPAIIGYYSTVGVVKYTGVPKAEIANLEIGSGQINMHDYSYTGVFTAPSWSEGLNKYYDSVEKAYTYRFDLYNNNGDLVHSSGDLLHNTLEDEELNVSRDTYTINQDLDANKSYFLEYTVTTVNGLEAPSGKYRIMQKKSINPEIKADLIPTLNYENGYINLTLNGQKSDDGVEYAATGAYRIMRASEEDNYTTWSEILRFALYGQQPSRWMWNDFTVKQGVKYKYALQQYSEYLYSNRLESEPIYVDFEHAFLYDGHKQLKIKYNPKVSTFKNTLLESKMDTIGGKHPFIFRNGNVKYKEFPISGLISCQLDEEFLFVDKDNFGRFDGTSNLIGENIASEREFKLAVLEWLNNGEPKIFRSPSEGNYIVRLLNVSMTPNDTVGRMLHTFTATAYEIADFNYENMADLGLISTQDPTTEQLRWETIELNQDGLGGEDNILNYVAVALRFEGMVPGDRLWIDDGEIKTQLVYNTETGEYVNEALYVEQVFDKITGEPILDENGQETYQAVTGYEVTIGATGSYIVDLNLGATIQKVNFRGSPDNANADWKLVQHQGTLTYAYYSKVQNRFNTISNIEITDVPLQQFIGEHDIFEEIEDIKTEIQGFYWIHASLRDIQRAYYGTDLYGTGYYFNTEYVKTLKAQYLQEIVKDFEELKAELWAPSAEKAESELSSAELLLRNLTFGSTYYYNNYMTLIRAYPELSIYFIVPAGRNVYEMVGNTELKASLNEQLLDEKHVLNLEAHVLYSAENLTSGEKYYLDGFSKKVYPLNEYSSMMYINGNPLDIAIWQYDDKKDIDPNNDEYIIIAINEQTYKNPKNITGLSCGNGVYLEVGYQKQIIDYAIEDDYKTYPKLSELKRQTTEAYNALYGVIYSGSDSENQSEIIEQYRKNYEIIYADFIAELERVLEEQEAAQGDVAV